MNRTMTNVTFERKFVNFLANNSSETKLITGEEGKKTPQICLIPMKYRPTIV